MRLFRTAVVNRARDQLLAGPGFTGDQHGTATPCHELDAGDHILHRTASPDDAVLSELVLLLRQQVPQAVAGLLLLDGPTHAHEQLVDVERFLQVVAHAEFHRLDRVADGAMRGHHQHAGRSGSGSAACSSRTTSMPVRPGMR